MKNSKDLVQQKEQLDRDIRDISEYIKTEDYKTLDMAEQGLLPRQLSLMKELVGVLNERLAAAGDLGDYNPFQATAEATAVEHNPDLDHTKQEKSDDPLNVHTPTHVTNAPANKAQEPKAAAKEHDHKKVDKKHR